MSAPSPSPAPPAGPRMLALAAGAAALLDADAADGLRRFLRGCRTADGAFRGRTAASDLYYTSFGLALARLFGETPDAREAAWLRGFGDGAGLDLVHFASLVRCLALADALPDPAAWRRRLAGFRLPDGSWAASRGGPSGGPYAAFLALLAMEDLGGADDPDATARSVLACRSPDGGFRGAPSNPASAPRVGPGGSPGRAQDSEGISPPADQALDAPPLGGASRPALPIVSAGATSVTAAAVVVLSAAGRAAPREILDWLLARRDPRGGWLGGADAPAPDLLSTAVALAALRIAGRTAPDPVEPDVDFIERHMRPGGGFAGHPADPVADVEYTWYALLALGAIFAA
ncbi:MAG: terpene cyclase/mutase family protein [Lentisphaerae bacterium]|nr:terpene cyclase/mutase family protein [Lentisphaerota bacterium]